jgi:hypothetical protein
MQRKRRTREHVIEEMGLNFLERQVLRRGHQLQRFQQREYGWDATMFHFAANGEVEDGEVRFQVKATDHLDSRNGRVRCRVATADLHYWYWQQLPFVLVVYDAQADRGYWLALQAYVDEHPDTLNPRQKTVTVSIPAANKINVRIIDRWRDLSLAASR